MKVIGIVGSRRRNMPGDYLALVKALDTIYQEGDSLVSGGCPQGADRFAEKIAKDRQISILIHYAKWNLYGKAAGPIRNKLIAEDCDILIALPAKDRTGGTEYTITYAEELGKEIILS